MISQRDGGDFLRSYPGRRTFAAEARRDVLAFARRCGFGDADLEDIGIALGEMLVFGMHGTPGRLSPFRVAAWAYPDRIEIELELQSVPPAAVSGAADADPEILALRGLGLRLVRKVMTRVSMSEGGRTVRLMKRRSAG